MKQPILLLIFALCCSIGFAQTKPNWKQINGTPFESVTAYGAKGDGVTDDTIPVNRAFATGSSVYFPPGHYIGDFVASAGLIIQGAGPNATTLTAKTAGRAAIVFSNYTQWNYSKIIGIAFDGSSQTRDGISFETVDNGRFRLEQCSFQYCDIGIDRSKGNIGLSVESTNFNENNIGMYNVGSATLGMHAGCVDINMCHFAYHDVAGVYVNDTFPNTGQFSIRNSVFEYNIGHDIYSAAFGGTSYSAMSIDNLWMEKVVDQAPPAQVTTPDGILATSTQLWLHGTQAEIKNTRFIGLNAVNSQLLLDMASCRYTEMGTYPADVTLTNSNVTWINRYNIGQYAGHPDGLTTSYFGASNSGQAAGDLNWIPVHQIPHRTHTSVGWGPSVITSFECASSATYIDSSDTVASGTFDGLLFERAVVLVATTSVKILDWASGTHNLVIPNTYNVWSLGVKRNNIGSEALHSKLHLFSNTTTGGYIVGPPIDYLREGVWTTVGGIFQARASYTATPTVRLGMVGHGALAPGNYTISGFQCVAFDNFQAAHAYFLSGAFSRSSDGY